MNEPLAEAAARLAEGEAGPLDMANDAGCYELGRAVYDAAHHAFGRDRSDYPSAWVDALERDPVESPSRAMEVPPWQTILRPDRQRARLQHLGELRCHFRQAVGL